MLVTFFAYRKSFFCKRAQAILCGGILGAPSYIAIKNQCERSRLMLTKKNTLTTAGMIFGAGAFKSEKRGIMI